MGNRIEYVVVILVRTLVRALPRRASLGVGATLGRLFYYLHGPRRILAVANLRAAFPSRTQRECRAILRSTFEHFGRHVVELLNFDAMSANQMARLVEIDGEERVEQAMARGKGVMFYTGHFGYWELQVMVHATRFTPIVMVARTLDNPLLERLIERTRTRVGTRVIPRQGAIRGLLRALLDKASVGMMIDQHIAGPECGHGRLLQSAGCHDVCGRSARVAHRRPGHSSIRPTAARRALPLGVRSPDRAAGGR